MPECAAVAFASGARSRAPGCLLDPHDFVHGIVEGAFGLVFPDPQARRRLRLKGMSRAAVGAMTWYLWTLDRPGAYAIAFDADGAHEADGSVPLTLRYYPSPDESVFGRFSPAERAARVCAAFDATGTPTPAGADELAPELFRIGVIALAPQGEGRFALRLHAPRRWAEASGEGEARVRLRDVPALELALPLVDALVGGVAYLGRAAPSSVALWRRHGGDACDRVREQREGTPASSFDDVQEQEDWELEFSGLAVPGRGIGYDATCVDPPRSDVPWFVHAAPTAPIAPPWPVRLLWWTAAAWQFDPVGSFCGHCAAEEWDPDTDRGAAWSAHAHAGTLSFARCREEPHDGQSA